MVSYTPKQRSSLSTSCNRIDSVIEDVNPETDAVNATDVVVTRSPLIIKLSPESNDADAVDELNSAANEEERDCDNAVLISAPAIVPT